MRVGEFAEGEQLRRGRLALLVISVAQARDRILDLLQRAFGITDAELNAADLGERDGELAVARRDIELRVEQRELDEAAIAELHLDRGAARGWGDLVRLRCAG